MAKHIGIVACSTPGAALCYRTICDEAEALMGAWNHPEISIHNIPMAEHMKCIGGGDWRGVADLMLASVKKLATVGADFAICPDNTIHQAFDMVAERSPLPWLHIAHEVAVEAKRRGFKRVGLTGTKYLMEGPVYPPKFAAVGVEMRIPGEEQRREINRIIFEELVYGKVKPEALRYFQQVIEGFQREGCDAVALSCTEIPLIVNDGNSALPTLDSTRLLAKAALREALKT